MRPLARYALTQDPERGDNYGYVGLTVSDFDMNNKIVVLVLATLGVALNSLWTRDGFAQGDLQGRWATTLSEDADMTPGAEVGNYIGLPLNDAARRYAESWQASRFSQLEHQCRSHTIPYMMRGPTFLRIWDEVDPETQLVVSIRIQLSLFEQARVIWMDGREHPAPEAPHTWMGFSTGRWEGNQLVVDTTHIKHGYLRRNGPPQSDQATVREYFVRHGDLLTNIAVLTDPVYLTEPLVKSSTFVLNGDVYGEAPWMWPCEAQVESLAPGVPHYFPGENPLLDEPTYGLPREVLRGGAETLYPGFIE